MEQRQLGKTGLSVSVLGQGGAAFGQQYGAVSATEVAECVHAAIDAGVNLMDVAAYYGKGVAEDYLGRALEGGWRDKVHICTKACRLDRDVFDFTPEGTRKCFEASLKRLRTDHVEILLAHDIEFADDYEYVFNETYHVLQQLKKEGKTRFIGMSCYPLGLLKQAIERCDLDVVISYAHCNLFNTRLLTELMPVAEARGVGVMNASPLAMGLLTNQGPQPWFPGQPEVVAACRKAAELCRERGADISFLGMQFAYAQKRIPCTLTGAARKSELEVNLKALSAPVDPQLLADVMKVLDPVRDWTWPCGNWKG
ncbi:MAG: aldo/keto reductase [Planctomycetes bacterium]|nr:aldo/keto reductase [Planctomycetota bacterium]